MKATYQMPTSNDSAEIRKRKMEESNFNTRLLHVVREAITIATSLSQRQSAAVAGPLSHDQALELAHLLDKAYSGRLAPIGLNPHLDPNQVGATPYKDSKLKATEIFPICAENLKKITVHQAETQKYPPTVILVAAKKLVVSIVDCKTRVDLEKEFAERHSEMKKVKADPRKEVPSESSFGVTATKSYSQITGSSQSVIIQDIISLVRGLVSDVDDAKFRTEASS